MFQFLSSTAILIKHVKKLVTVYINKQFECLFSILNKCNLFTQIICAGSSDTVLRSSNVLHQLHTTSFTFHHCRHVLYCQGVVEWISTSETIASEHPWSVIQDGSE